MEAWRAKLEHGDIDAAWALFLERYRRLLLVTIRRLVAEDEVLDAFGYVCQRLSADGLARLKRYHAESPRRARFSTWLVAVVHNRVVDWLRQREGRRRVTAPAGLSARQQQIFFHVFVEQRSHSETYELLSANGHNGLSFRMFLQELKETYRVVERARPRGVMHYFAAPPPIVAADASAETAAATSEMTARLAAALEAIEAEDRAALQLFVVEGMPAADVARIVGWPNAKAVYNRVYRALKGLRSFLERDGLRREDL